MKKKINWDHFILLYKQSGLSRQAFCRLHDLRYCQFLYHLNKNPTDIFPEKFLSLKLDEVVSPSDKKMHLSWPNGVRLSLPFDESVLKMILRYAGLR